uniref:Uncharacterized protein n=1 Tax=Dunaliella tertiolecta TaxID=3047 RepID=A0A7S3QXZ8_DUNTE
MVLLHMKRSEMEQFLYETSVAASVKETVAQLAELHNLRAKIQVLKMEGEELAKHGPAKLPEKQGLDEYSETHVEKGPFYASDPTGRRTGNACDPQVSKVLLKTLDEAVAAASRDQVARKVPLTHAALREAVDNVRGAVMICYPMGLPEWDLVRLLLEDKEGDACTQYGHETLDPGSSTLWFAGKQMINEKPLSEYLGRHEKTKAVVKLQKKGAGAPSREPIVDPETQKAMMAWHYKKQEEQKVGGTARSRRSRRWVALQEAGGAESR